MGYSRTGVLIPTNRGKMNPPTKGTYRKTQIVKSILASVFEDVGAHIAREKAKNPSAEKTAIFIDLNAGTGGSAGLPGSPIYGITELRYQSGIYEMPARYIGFEWNNRDRENLLVELRKDALLNEYGAPVRYEVFKDNDSITRVTIPNGSMGIAFSDPCGICPIIGRLVELSRNPAWDEIDFLINLATYTNVKTQRCRKVRRAPGRCANCKYGPTFYHCVSQIERSHICATERPHIKGGWVLIYLTNNEERASDVVSSSNCGWSIGDSALEALNEYTLTKRERGAA